MTPRPRRRDLACLFPDCQMPVENLRTQLCVGHWGQHRRGDELRFIPRTPEERFWAKVQKTETCWIWIGSSNHLGYGHIWSADERRLLMAHRVSLAMSGQTIPDDYDVDHLCRNPPCVRPDHLEPVTHAENLARAPHSAVQWQRAKTHCPHGHEYTSDNTSTKTNSSGGLSRECRTCLANNQRAYRARRRARREAA